MRVLITGASSGIGRDMAIIFGKKGYDLVLVARDEKRLNEAKQELENNNVKVEIKVMDLSNEENCIRLHEEVKNIDILINNAGFGDCGDFAKTDLNKEINMIKTNIVAYHILTKLYLIDMKKKDDGKILNVASIAGFMPGPLMATYYATKAYVVRLTEAIREELKKDNSKVQLSILCPGPVDTNFNNVANVKFNLKEANSQDIANYTIKKLEQGRFYIFPGIGVKIAKIGAKILPSSIMSNFTYKIQTRKLNRK